METENARAVANAARPEGDPTDRAALKLGPAATTGLTDTVADSTGIVKGDACAECGRTLDLEATVYRARGGGFRCGGCEVRGERVYFSRFPDAQPPAELVTIHEHLLERGRCLVVEWFWDSLESTYFQRSVVNVPSLQNAKEYAPPRSVPVPVPAEFGLLAYEVRS